MILCARPLTALCTFRTINSERSESSGLAWLSKRLQSALKALCCLAESGNGMQSQEIAERIRVSKAETAKILQLFVWGGFVRSRRGSKGGFHLAAEADEITMSKVMDFFLFSHSPDPDDDLA